MPDLSVSVVVYRTPIVELEPLFASVKATSLPLLFDVVDNGDSQELASYCQTHGLNYINSGGNIGFGKGHNLSLQRHIGNTKYHAVINPDVCFAKGVLESLKTFMDANPDVGQVMPRIFYPDGKVQYLAKLLPNPFLLLVRRFFPGFLGKMFQRMEERYELVTAPMDRTIEVPNLSGCFMFLRCETLKRVGLFDTRYFMYMEDMDLTRRIHRIARTVCFPGVSVTHAFDKGSYKNLRLLTFHMKSAIKYFNKWGWFFDRERADFNRATLQMIHHPGATRILHVYKTFFPDSYGGVEQAILELCRGAIRSGMVAEIFTLSHTAKRVGQIDYQGIKVTQIPVDFEIASTPFSLRALYVFWRMQRHFDIIHVHFPWPFADLLYVLSGSQKPVVVTYHSDIIKQRMLKYLYRPVMGVFLRKARIVVPTSPNYLATSLPLRRYRAKSWPIPLGLDEAKYPKPNQSAVVEYRARWGDDYCCFIGVFRYYKGLQYLIEAAKQVPCNIVLIGDGPEMPSMRALVDRLGLRNVHFLGAVDDQAKIDVLEGAYAFVFPSQYRSEAFGLGLVEAAMHSKPMLSCEIGTGTSYINLSNYTGVVVAPFKSNAVAAGIRTLLEDPKRAAVWGKQARERFETMFTAEGMVHEYHLLYQKLKSGKVVFPS